VSRESPRYISVLLAQLKRDLHINFLKRAEWLNPIIFLVLVQSLFPLALGAESKLLTQSAPAVIWISALLSTLISLESLFRDDFDDGSLEQMSLAPVPFFIFCEAKIICHWLMSGLPLVIICPVLALSFDLSPEVLPVMVLSLLLSTPVLCCISALASALTLNAKRGGVLLSLIVLPLYVPVLIFGAGALMQSSFGLSAAGALYMLAALFVFVFSVSPFALSAALKLSLSDA
jgi:heme exporter protein B